ncbi:hypothetical protein NLX83_35610 [Allokutzneria sp. A3M-2-11 16]|uniref:hypothetical protein n=1 Tax=Allokutzneria sp. A3M-2-11 16 TaxID=2962043 RepID=UPI0020B8BAA9|nr:hypothetical protein [Allokutzneria sp. A3M-2-11 16]MCP3804612.1 hypothetical protein [Allokutzneria sp. A3M-2-11 16]
MLLTSCSSPPGDAETDRQANTLASAISYPRQDSAAGFARAALAVWKGNGAQLAVLDMQEIPRTDLDPAKQFAHLVIRIHRPAPEAPKFGPRIEALNACYGMDFNFYGIIGEPERISCPDKAPVTPPPPTPDTIVPDGAEAALRKLLAALPPTPTDAQVRDALDKELPKPRADHLPPAVDVRVQGEDVGVSLRAGSGDDISCLTGSRVRGTVTVGWLSRIEAMPGERGCSAGTALGR